MIRLAAVGTPRQLEIDTTHVRVDVFPDGGLGRVPVHGEIVPAALARLRERYLSLIPR